MRKHRMGIVLPNYNGRDLLDANLNCMLQVLGGAEVVIVDDGSTDGSVDYVQENFPGIQLIARKTNGGFSVAVNDGIRAASGEFIILLNNDVELTPDFLDPILPVFEDESVFAVSPRIILPSRGNIDEGCKTGFWHHGLFYTDQRQNVTQITPIPYVTGCAAVYRRSMLEELGGFDEAYSPFYWEDVDLCYRAWKRGWRSLYQPASTVYHEHSASISKLNASYTARIKARNSLLFIWRNIEDEGLRARHRRWLPLVLLRRAAAGDRSFLLGLRDARLLRKEAAEALGRESAYRKLPDRAIFTSTKVVC